jgi:ParB-like chromosome segregation protein Spo0J
MNTETKQDVLKTTRTDIAQVDPRNLVVEEGFNRRMDYGDIHALALSLVEFGMIEPIEGFKVRGEDKYIVTEGHRRQLALMLAFENHAKGVKGFENISKIERVMVLPSSNNLKERLFIMAITGEGKKPLTDLEKAQLYSDLIEMGKAEGKKRSEVIAEIIAKIGVSKASVYNTLQISELPQVIKDRIAEGVIAAGAVVAITRELKVEAEQVKAVERAIENAAKESETTGKKVKATVKDVKGLKAKTPMARLQEVVDKLQKNEVKNVRANTLINLVKGLNEKHSLKELYELFA